MTAEYDLAILDINLHGRYVDPVADLIALRGKPFIFASGYGAEVLPSLLRRHPLLRKPVALDELRLTIDRIFQDPPASVGLTAEPSFQSGPSRESCSARCGGAQPGHSLRSTIRRSVASRLEAAADPDARKVADETPVFEE